MTHSETLTTSPNPLVRNYQNLEKNTELTQETLLKLKK